MEKGISFAGNGMDDVSSKMPSYMSGSLGSGSAIEGSPDTNQGNVSASETLAQTMGMPSASGAGEIKFAGNV